MSGAAAGVVPAVLVAAAVLAAGAGRRGPARRLGRLAHAAADGGLAPRAGPGGPGRGRWWAAGAAGTAAALLVGGAAGLLLGGALVALLPRALGRLESRADRERRRRAARQAPEVADLLAACLAAGSPADHAAAAVADALGDPVAGPLRVLVASLRLGAEPAAAWRALSAEPGLEDLGQAVARSVDSGAPLGGVLPRVADDLRRQVRADLEVAARQAGVRVVTPLAVCFLPGFLLLGVVPVVASLFAGVLG